MTKIYYFTTSVCLVYKIKPKIAFFFTLAKSNCTYFVKMGLKYLTLACNNVTLLQSCSFKTC